jgi:hypothetical protein
MSCLPCSHAKAARTPLFIHNPHLFNEQRSIVFLAGAQRVRKIVRNLLCVAQTFFVSANTTTSDLCSTVRQPSSVILMNCRSHCGCSGLWDLMPSNGIFTKYSILTRNWNTGAWIFIIFTDVSAICAPSCRSLRFTFTSSKWFLRLISQLKYLRLFLEK